MTVLSVVPAVPATLARPAAVAVDPTTGGPVAVVPTGSSTVGTAVMIELQSPSNSAAVFTIPANKGFTGVAYCVAAGTAGGTVSLSAATGGVFYATTSPTNPTPVAVSVASQTGTNAVTVVLAGGATAPTIVLVGYFK